MAVVDSPGDPKNPRSFMLCHENENKGAAYLGFTMVTQLRHFVVSWPRLRAYTAFSKIAKNLSLDGAMVHLRGHQNFSGIADPEKAFPFMQNDTEMAKKTVKSKRLAAILRRMQEEIIVLPTLLPGENTTRQADAITQFNSTVGLDKYATIEPMELVMPRLHHEAGGEDDIEAVNRCWNVLRYMRHAIHGKGFEKKFSEPQISRKTTVKLEHTPTWMRPKNTTTADAIQKSATVARADNLSKKSFKLLLDPRLHVPDIEEDLQSRIDDIAATVAVPNAEQPFTIDPRLFESSPALRDQIRRQFKCNIYHTNINQFVIEYSQRTQDGRFFEEDGKFRRQSHLAAMAELFERRGA